MNQIQLIGNLGRDPDMSYTPGGKAVTKFSLAVNRRGKDAQGQPTTETQWFNCVAWERLAETVNTYCHKGSKVFVQGRMTSRKYTDKSNIERDFWEVTLTDLELLTPKAEGAGSGSGYADAPVDDGVPF